MCDAFISQSCELNIEFVFTLTVYHAKLTENDGNSRKIADMIILNPKILNYVAFVS
jgi:hypothetical protein